jgi:hypothetical protein
MSAVVLLVATAAAPGFAETYEAPVGDVHDCGSEQGVRWDLAGVEETLGQCLAPRSHAVKVAVTVRTAAEGGQRVRAAGAELTESERACVENRVIAEWIDRRDATCRGAVSFIVPSGPLGGGEIDVATEPTRCDGWSPEIANVVKSVASPAKRCFAIHAPQIEGIYRTDTSIGLLRGGASMSMPGTPLPQALEKCLADAIHAVPVKLAEGQRCSAAVAVRHTPAGKRATTPLEAVVRSAPVPAPGGGGGAGSKGVSFANVSANGACGFLGIVTALGTATKAVDRCIPSGGTWSVKMHVTGAKVQVIEVTPASKTATCIGAAITATQFPGANGPCDISFGITR